MPQAIAPQPVALFVDIEVDPRHRDAFHELMLAHIDGTLAEEPGCLALNVYVDARDPSRYALYEVYADQAAVAYHGSTARVGRFRRATDAMITKRRIWSLGDEIDVSNFPGRPDG